MKVIDVSYHNGTIDFNKVKQSGIECVIIRCGYGDNHMEQDDKKYKEYMGNAIKYGFKIGVYIYSYAMTTQQAENEAEHILRLVTPYKEKISNVLWYDIEEEKQSKICFTLYNAFKNVIERNGYKAGLYTGDSYYSSYFKNNVNPVYKWIARYNTKPPVNKYDIWQYSENGNVAGISGNVDLNKCVNDSIFTSKTEYTPETAITFLCNKGVINTPDYWLNAIKVVKYLGDLLVNIADKFSD